MKNSLEQLKEIIAARPLSAMQGLSLPEPHPGQLHRTGMWEKNYDWFYLVTGISDERCDVIPGCFDSLQAGPDDIVLPPSVFGDCFFLSLDLSASLPRKAVKEGFAKLDDVTYDRVVESLEKYKADRKGGSVFYPFALPYVSRHDSRIAYHARMADLLRDNQTEAEHAPTVVIRSLFRPSEFSYALAASDETHNIRRKCSIDGRSEILAFEYSRDEKKVWIRIFADTGERARTLDGTEIINAAEQVLGVIAEGHCVFAIADDFDGAIAIRLADGAIRVLTPLF